MKSIVLGLGCKQAFAGVISRAVAHNGGSVPRVKGVNYAFLKTPRRAIGHSQNCRLLEKVLLLVSLFGYACLREASKKRLVLLEQMRNSLKGRYARIILDHRLNTNY